MERHSLAENLLFFQHALQWVSWLIFIIIIIINVIIIHVRRNLLGSVESVKCYIKTRTEKINKSGDFVLSRSPRPSAVSRHRSAQLESYRTAFENSRKYFSRESQLYNCQNNLLPIISDWMSQRKVAIFASYTGIHLVHCPRGLGSRLSTLLRLISGRGPDESRTFVRSWHCHSALKASERKWRIS